MRSRMERVVDNGPVPEITRNGMADRCVVMSKRLGAERARSLDVKEVAVLAVPNVPKVPEPVLFEPQCHRGPQDRIKCSCKARTRGRCDGPLLKRRQFVPIWCLSPRTSACPRRGQVGKPQKLG